MRLRSRQPGWRHFSFPRFREQPASPKAPAMDQPVSPANPSPTLRSTSETSGLRRLSSLLRPIRGFRLAYLPLMMVYFAYGALGIIDVSRDMWIKERFTLNPAELAGIGVWVWPPMTVKMVVGARGG